MNILQVENLVKDFKGFRAVDDISFSLSECEILGLLGPNGAGKTTTLQMLLGILTPTSGHISYFGKDLSVQRSEILEKVNFSSAYTEMPSRLTVKENLVYLSHLFNISDRKKRVKKIAKLFRLESLMEKRIHQLSAGQQTRVNLGKAFINFPRVLLLDEPTASLDPEIADYIRKKLLAEREDYKLSIIITSHNMAEVEEICDRVIFINHGRVIASDTPAKLAKTLKIAHLELLIPKNMAAAERFIKNRDLAYAIKDRKMEVDINEKLIPELLQTLMNHGIFYDEININKPTLEDYFLNVTRKEQ